MVGIAAEGGIKKPAVSGNILDQFVFRTGVGYIAPSPYPLS